MTWYALLFVVLNLRLLDSFERAMRKVAAREGQRRRRRRRRAAGEPVGEKESVEIFVPPD